MKKGTLIAREDLVIIEVIPESVMPLGEELAGQHPLRETEFLGEVVLQGEIVDSKCCLGVMNPGNLKTHRACTINCITGGIPPVLVLRDEGGAANYILLVGSHGEAINEQILELVAEPLTVSGRLERRGKQLVLYADSEAIKRLPDSE